MNSTDLHFATTRRGGLSPAPGQLPVASPVYTYRWKSNAKRALMFGRCCRILARGAMNSACVEFPDGMREIVSRNALKRFCGSCLSAVRQVAPALGRGVARKIGSESTGGEPRESGFVEVSTLGPQWSTTI